MFDHQHTWAPLACIGSEPATRWPHRPERLWLCGCDARLADARQCGAFETVAESELTGTKERAA